MAGSAAGEPPRPLDRPASAATAGVRVYKYRELGEERVAEFDDAHLAWSGTFDSSSSSGHSEYRDRLRAIQLRKTGWSKAQIAADLGRPEKFVARWWQMEPLAVPRPPGVHQYLAHGMAEGKQVDRTDMWRGVEVMRAFFKDVAGLYEEVVSTFSGWKQSASETKDFRTASYFLRYDREGKMRMMSMRSCGYEPNVVSRLDALVQKIHRKVGISDPSHGAGMYWFSDGDASVGSHRHVFWSARVALGAERIMMVDTTPILMQEGDLVIIGPQRHGVPPMPEVAGGSLRISVPFRPQPRDGGQVEAGPTTEPEGEPRDEGGWQGGWGGGGRWEADEGGGWEGDEAGPGWGARGDGEPWHDGLEASALQLQALGFEPGAAAAALRACGGEVERAADLLLESGAAGGEAEGLVALLGGAAAEDGGEGSSGDEALARRLQAQELQGDREDQQLLEEEFAEYERVIDADEAERSWDGYGDLMHNAVRRASLSLDTLGPQTVYSLSATARTEKQFFELLSLHLVKVLYDFRPTDYRDEVQSQQPFFEIRALKHLCRQRGVHYRHVAVGRETAFGVLRHLQSDEVQHVLVELVWRAKHSGRTAFLGSEEDWRADGVRLAVGEELSRHGHVVEHEDNSGALERHDWGRELPGFLLQEEARLRKLDAQRRAGELQRPEKSAADRSTEAVARALAVEKTRVDVSAELRDAESQTDLIRAQRRMVRLQAAADKQEQGLGKKALVAVPGHVQREAARLREHAEAKKAEKAKPDAAGNVPETSGGASSSCPRPAWPAAASGPADARPARLGRCDAVGALAPQGGALLVPQGGALLAPLADGPPAGHAAAAAAARSGVPQRLLEPRRAAGRWGLRAVTAERAEAAEDGGGGSAEDPPLPPSPAEARGAGGLAELGGRAAEGRAAAAEGGGQQPAARGEEPARHSPARAAPPAGRWAARRAGGSKKDLMLLAAPLALPLLGALLDLFCPDCGPPALAEAARLLGVLGEGRGISTPMEAPTPQTHRGGGTPAAGGGGASRTGRFGGALPRERKAFYEMLGVTFGMVEALFGALEAALQALAVASVALIVAGCLPLAGAVADFVAGAADASYDVTRGVYPADAGALLTAGAAFCARAAGVAAPIACAGLEAIPGMRPRPQQRPPGEMEVIFGMLEAIIWTPPGTPIVAPTAFRTMALPVELAILRLPAIHVTLATTGPTYQADSGSPGADSGSGGSAWAGSDLLVVNRLPLVVPATVGTIAVVENISDSAPALGPAALARMATTPALVVPVLTEGYLQLKPPTVEAIPTLAPTGAPGPSGYITLEAAFGTLEADADADADDDADADADADAAPPAAAMETFPLDDTDDEALEQEGRLEEAGDAACCPSGSPGPLLQYEWLAKHRVKASFYVGGVNRPTSPRPSSSMPRSPSPGSCPDDGGSSTRAPDSPDGGGARGGAAAGRHVPFLDLADFDEGEGPGEGCAPVGESFRPPELMDLRPYRATTVDPWCVGWNTFYPLAAQPLFLSADPDGGVPADFRGMVGKSFRPPELMDLRPYRAATVDSWCLGWSTLYLLVAQPLFLSADPKQQDPDWLLFSRGNYGALRQQKNCVCSQMALDFILRPMSLDPSKRMSIADALGHAGRADPRFGPCLLPAVVLPEATRGGQEGTADDQAAPGFVAALGVAPSAVREAATAGGAPGAWPLPSSGMQPSAVAGEAAVPYSTSRQAHGGPALPPRKPLDDALAGDELHGDDRAEYASADGRIRYGADDGFGIGSPSDGLAPTGADGVWRKGGSRAAYANVSTNTGIGAGPSKGGGGAWPTDATYAKVATDLHASDTSADLAPDGGRAEHIADWQRRFSSTARIPQVTPPFDGLASSSTGSPVGYPFEEATPGGGKRATACDALAPAEAPGTDGDRPWSGLPALPAAASLPALPRDPPASPPSLPDLPTPPPDSPGRPACLPTHRHGLPALPARPPGGEEGRGVPARGGPWQAGRQAQAERRAEDGGEDTSDASIGFCTDPPEHGDDDEEAEDAGGTDASREYSTDPMEHSDDEEMASLEVRARGCLAEPRETPAAGAGSGAERAQETAAWPALRSWSANAWSVLVEVLAGLVGESVQVFVGILTGIAEEVALEIVARVAAPIAVEILAWIEATRGALEEMVIGTMEVVFGTLEAIIGALFGALEVIFGAPASFGAPLGTTAIFGTPAIFVTLAIFGTIATFGVLAFAGASLEGSTWTLPSALEASSGMRTCLHHRR
ncbi:unnamed protein product [Prorocentrum cordatum]|uniref:UBA domain-containing protein n=1 Tax=Prorocentrum cordatum TaxID=2364126 RepID=A0ABN9WPU5_9DINO|nr:unnamed protein product [Polarella glacialis]